MLEHCTRITVTADIPVGDDNDPLTATFVGISMGETAAFEADLHVIKAAMVEELSDSTVTDLAAAPHAQGPSVYQSTRDNSGSTFMLSLQGVPLARSTEDNEHIHAPLKRALTSVTSSIRRISVAESQSVPGFIRL